MKTLFMAVVVAASTVAAGTSLAQGTQQDLKGMEKMGQRDDTQAMTPVQQADYKARYEAAKAQWAKMTPDQQKAAIEAARQKLKDLSYAELVGQRDDMQQDRSPVRGAQGSVRHLDDEVGQPHARIEAGGPQGRLGQEARGGHGD